MEENNIHWQRCLLGLLMAEWYEQSGEVPAKSVVEDMKKFVTYVAATAPAKLNPNLKITEEHRHRLEQEGLNPSELEGSHWTAALVASMRATWRIQCACNSCAKYSPQKIVPVVRTVSDMKQSGTDFAKTKKAVWRFVHEALNQHWKAQGKDEIGPTVFCEWISLGMGETGYLDKGHLKKSARLATCVEELFVSCFMKHFKHVEASLLKKSGGKDAPTDKT